MPDRIQTTYWPKPIPTDAFDWSAVTDNYEPDGPVGYGASEEAAVRDLKEQLEASDDA